MDQPGFVLFAVELETQRLTGAYEQQLAHVVARLGPDQLVSPGLVDATRFDRPCLESR